MLSRLGLLAHDGTPCLIVDSVGCQNLSGQPHAENVAAVLTGLFREKRHQVWTPADLAEITSCLKGIVAGIKAGGRCHLAIDEIWRWIYPWVNETFLGSFVAHRHWLKGASVLFSTVHVGNVRSDLLQCVDRAFLFAQEAPKAFEKIEDCYGFSREELPTFPPPGRFVTYPKA
jgi:hypothetical protein